MLNRLTHNASIPAGSILSSGALAWGWTLPGNWPIGVYKVDLNVDSKLVASGELEVVDLLIPFSGRFLAIRDDLTWSTGSLTYDNQRDLESLTALMRTDPNMAAPVAGHQIGRAPCRERG